jgi:glycosyltransferase involved in cell wall biosynthesis
MRILVLFYDLNNLGGIINHAEGLTGGLRALGHEVTSRLLVWKENIASQPPNWRRSLASENGAIGVPFDQQAGWAWPPEMRFPYAGKRNLQEWKAFANRFDLVIWQIAVPTMQGQNRGNTDWLELYDLDVPQIAVVHDGNLRDGYPWISLISDKLSGAVGVHPCAYNSLKCLPIPRAMALNPQIDIAARVKAADVSKHERSGWLSLQTFKKWKRVDELVRATALMENTQAKRLAGGGIEYYYMTSPDKVRPEYLDANGNRIWDNALGNGMEYLGYLSNDQREMELHKSRFLIDPSWSKKYAPIGDHFNRTVIDGLIGGCVPIARNLGVATNEKGVGEIFRPNENYCMIPWNATPQEFAEYVDEFVAMPEKRRWEMLAEGRKLLPLFDYRRTAQAFIDLADGKTAGVYAKKNDVGVKDDHLLALGQAGIDGFFSMAA